MLSKLPVKGKSKTGKLLKIATCRKDIRKTEPQSTTTILKSLTCQKAVAHIPLITTNAYHISLLSRSILT